jgi:hypothetical protein
VERIGQELKRGDFIYRYVVRDDFGEPETAFLICTSGTSMRWRRSEKAVEARALFDKIMIIAIGLVCSPRMWTRRRVSWWGNFPQAYSMVGLINSAMNPELELGGSVMTRLIVVSNRVALPRDRSARAGGLAVGVLSALKRSGGMWFGWSGETNESPAPQPKVMKSGGITYATIDFTAEEFDAYYNGYCNSTSGRCCITASAWSRHSRQHQDAYMRINAAFRRPAGDDGAARATSSGFMTIS